MASQEYYGGGQHPGYGGPPPGQYGGGPPPGVSEFMMFLPFQPRHVGGAPSLSNADHLANRTTVLLLPVNTATALLAGCNTNNNNHLPHKRTAVVEDA